MATNKFPCEKNWFFCGFTIDLLDYATEGCSKPACDCFSFVDCLMAALSFTFSKIKNKEIEKNGRQGIL